MDVPSSGKAPQFKHSILSDPETFQIQGIDITLVRSDLVFGPSQHGLFLGENVRIEKDETVIDIGCGSGIYAIYSALRGGIVSATEITKEAVEMTRYNALLNNVHVTTHLGQYFGDFTGNFDVLIANLPQKIILRSPGDAPPRGLSETEFFGTHGGSSGNEILMSFLDKARGHMTSNSRLYIQVYSLTNYKETLKKIAEYYSATELACQEFVEDELITVNVEGYLDLRERGVIEFENRDNHWYTRETAYELKLKS